MGRVEGKSSRRRWAVPTQNPPSDLGKSPSLGMRSEQVFDTIPAMNALRKALEELMCESLRELPESRVVEEFDEVIRAIEVLEVQRLRRLAEITRRNERTYAR